MRCSLYWASGQRTHHFFCGEGGSSAFSVFLHRTLPIPRFPALSSSCHGKKLQLTEVENIALWHNLLLIQPTCSLPTPTPGLTSIISMKKPQKRMLMPSLNQILGFSKLEVFRGPYCFVEGRTFLINCQRRISPNRGPNIDPRITHPLYIVGTVPRNAWRFGVYIKSLQLYLQPTSERLSPLIWSEFAF